jgi:hypothetical protein
MLEAYNPVHKKDGISNMYYLVTVFSLIKMCYEYFCLPDIRVDVSTNIKKQRMHM